MNILLLNDTTMKATFSQEHRVYALGMKDMPYPMPNQDHFDQLFESRPIMHISELVSLLPEDFVPDVLIHYETHNNFFYLGIEELPFPVIWRTIDNHLHQWQASYSAFYDLTLVAQPDSLEGFRTKGERSSHWLPLCCFPSLHFDKQLERHFDVTFVGDMNEQLKPERVSFFNELSQYVKVKVCSGLDQNEISTLYNSSKIVINEVMASDLNYRVYEAMADGALVLTPEIGNGQLELFGENSLVTYRDRDARDAADKIKVVLSNWNHYKEVAKQAQQNVLTNHTIEARATELLKLIDTVAIPEFIQRGSKVNVDTYLKNIPTLAAIHNMGYCGFEGVEYLLSKVESYGAGFSQQVAEHFRATFEEKGLSTLAIAFNTWLLKK
jgi:hypothetical protein